MDRVVNERIDVRRSITSIRSTGSKLVTFEDQKHRKKHPAPIYDNTKKDQQHYQPPTTTVPSKSRYDHSRPTMNINSDEDVTISNANESDDDTQPTQPGVIANIHPSPRKNLPASKPSQGISALVTGGAKPSTTSGAGGGGTTISAIVRPPVTKAKRITESFGSDR